MKLKKILSAVLVLVMLLSLAPSVALADSGINVNGQHGTGTDTLIYFKQAPSGRKVSRKA